MDITTITAKIVAKVHDTGVTTTDVIAWVNEAQDRIAARVGEDSVMDATLFEGIREYTWGDTLLSVEKVELLDSSYVFVRNLKTINFRDVEGDDAPSPEFYYLRGRATGVYPVPDSTTTGIIRMYGKQKFEDVDYDIDSPSAMITNHNIFVTYGCWQYWETQDEYQRATYYRTMFDADVELLLGDPDVPKNDDYSVIRGEW